MAPAPFPPIMNPGDDFDLDAELARIARAVMRGRHRDIPDPLLDDLLEGDDALRAEYETLIDQMRQPVAPRPLPRSGWLGSGIRVFEVTESPEGEIEIQMGRFSGRYAIVNSYTQHYVPNHPVHSVYNWALNFGGKR